MLLGFQVAQSKVYDQFDCRLEFHATFLDIVHHQPKENFSYY